MQQSLRPARKRVSKVFRPSRMLAEGKVYQVIQLNRCYTLVDTRDNLLCNRCGINMLGIESITQSGNTSCDFVKLDTLLTAV